MGVGDYIHSKETGQHRAANEASNPSRQFLAQQAKVGVPATNLVAPVPLGFNNGGLGVPGLPEEEAFQRDMFDTDIEGVDESTVAGTSVGDAEEFRVQPQPPQSHLSQLPSQTSNIQHHDADTRPSYQFRHGRRPYQSNWYESLGDKAMKSAGFESDDADDDTSQLTSVAGDDEREEPNDWYSSHRSRMAPDEPLSRRLENFWNASKKAPPKSTSRVNPETNAPVLVPSGSDSRDADQMLPGSGSRKITLPRSMTTTPRTRFSPPKPSLLEQLDNSPTRRGPGSRTRPRRSSVIDLRQRNNGNDANLFTSDNEKRDSVDGQSMTAFDITNVVALDEDDTLQDPFLKDSRSGSDPATSSKKRNLEPDYPPDVLYKKSFADLQAEPFDRAPPTTTTPTAIQPTPPQALDTAAEDKVSLLANISEQDRHNYLSNLSMDEWEACGDQLIDQFTNMLTKMKDLRHARRKTAAVFETEMRKRNEVVEEQGRELSSKMDDMRNGGAEVLRGRTP